MHRLRAAGLEQLGRLYSTHQLPVKGGHRLHVVTAGDRRSQAVLCIPGMLGTALSDFGPQLEGLSTRYHVVAYDPRGLGSSRPLKGAYEGDFYTIGAEDAAEIMDTLGHKQYSVLGWSDGACVACLLAASRPKQVQQLVLWGAAAEITADDVQQYNNIRDVTAWNPKARDPLVALYGLEGLQTLMDKAFTAYEDIYKAGGDICRGALSRIRCPTLLLHGDLDPVVGIHHGRKVYDAIRANGSDVRFFEWTGGRHNLHLKYAAAFNTKVVDFLAATRPRPDADVNAIGYGFMASQALFGGLELNLFDALATTSDGMTLEGIAQHIAMPAERTDVLQTLLTALCSLHLIHRLDGGRYVNSRSSGRFLVTSSPAFFGDYLRLQVGQQFYGRMGYLRDVLAGGVAPDKDYEAWFADKGEAEKYTTAQHCGSLETARAFAVRFGDILPESPQKFLDIGGGSGAFCIALSEARPQWSFTLLDFPSVVDVARRIVGESTAAGKVQFRPGSALEEWGVGAESHDIVLMSYLSGSVPKGSLPQLYTQALRALRPGGLLVLHDFMVGDGLEGPQTAALWALQHAAVNPTGLGLSVDGLRPILEATGFHDITSTDLIAGSTKVVMARKP